VKEDLLPLYRSCLTLLELERSLTELCNGRMLSDVIKKKPAVEYLFVGGTSPPENYDKSGLAYYYSRLMGASIKLREYYFLKAHGKEPRTLCTITKTNVMRYIEHMGELLKRVLNQTTKLEMISPQDVNEAKDSSKKEADEILSKPENLVDKFGEALQNALKVSVATNRYTRLIWHLRKIPKKYIKEFYPAMLSKEKFQLIQEILGLRKFIVPRVEDPELADLYTIYSFDHEIRVSSLGYIDGMSGVHDLLYLLGYLPSTTAYPYVTIGGCICRLNELIWGLFTYCRDDLAILLKEVPSPYDIWKNFCGNNKPAYWREYEYPKSYEVLSRLEELFPALFYGQMEIILTEDGERIKVYARW